LPYFYFVVTKQFYFGKKKGYARSQRFFCFAHKTLNLACQRLFFIFLLVCTHKQY
jgi:hypothetical protein